MRRKLIKIDSSLGGLENPEIFFFVWLAANISETLFKNRYDNSRNILRDVYTEMKRRIRRVVISSTYESRLHHGEWSSLTGSDNDQSSTIDS
jgi:hypothetical protein